MHLYVPFVCFDFLMFISFCQKTPLCAIHTINPICEFQTMKEENITRKPCFNDKGVFSFSLSLYAHCWLSSQCWKPFVTLTMKEVKDRSHTFKLRTTRGDIKKPTLRLEKVPMKERPVRLLLLGLASSAVSVPSSLLPWQWRRKLFYQEPSRCGTEWVWTLKLSGRWHWMQASSGFYLGGGFVRALGWRWQGGDGEVVGVFSVSDLGLFHQVVQLLLGHVLHLLPVGRRLGRKGQFHWGWWWWRWRWWWMKVTGWEMLLCNSCRNLCFSSFTELHCGRLVILCSTQTRKQNHKSGVSVSQERGWSNTWCYITWGVEEKLLQN